MKNRRSRRLVRLLAVPMILVLIGTASLAACRIDGPQEPAAPVQLQNTPSAATWWQPEPGTSWQWQLSGQVDTSLDVEMYDLDLFDTPLQVIRDLQAAGRVVICYFSAGSLEDWRPDAADYPAETLGRPLDGWPDERWLDIRKLETLKPVITARLDLAVSKGCDGVEPDNVDGYANATGFAISAREQLVFNTWLANEAHLRNLSVGLKNDLDQVVELQPHFDWALNEECFRYDECEELLPFIAAGKAVFGVEYDGDPADYCPRANALNLDWLAKNLELDAWQIACREFSGAFLALPDRLW